MNLINDFPHTIQALDGLVQSSQQANDSDLQYIAMALHNAVFDLDHDFPPEPSEFEILVKWLNLIGQFESV